MDYSTEEASAEKEIRDYGSFIWVLNPISSNYDPIEDKRTFISSTLSSAISSSISTISPIDTTSFPAAGVVTIEDEKILYASIKNNSLVGCQRGFESTTSTQHSSGSTISTIYEANKTVAIFQSYDERWVAEGLVETGDQRAIISSKDMTFEITPKTRIFFNNTFYIVKNPGKVAIDGKSKLLYKASIGA